MTDPRPSSPWRQRLVLLLTRRLFSSLAGVSAGDWLRLLWDNGIHIDVPYLPRALLLSLTSVPNAIDRWREDWLYGPALANVRPQAPVFILGHWRTGTTHLHNLLAADRRFAYPNLYQAFNPHTLLVNEDKLARFLAPWLPERRLMDDVRLGLDTPQEDEFALCAATGLSPYLGWAFPRRRAHYDRYLTFRGVPTREVERWKAALVLFVKKLTLKTGRPLLLKSPPHTARVRLLLEVFPDARFVHIRRDPYAVFQSTRHFERAAAPAMALQRSTERDLDARIIERYRALYGAYFEDRPLIPAGRLHELSFEELARDPVGRMRELYAELGLPDFEEARPAVEEHLRSVGDYRRNDYAPLPADARRRVAAAWGPFFEAWGYPT